MDRKTESKQKAPGRKKAGMRKKASVTKKKAIRKKVVSDALLELTSKNFKELGRPACAIFAWRAVMRVLPSLIGPRGSLGFWGQDKRSQHLAAVLAALDGIFSLYYQSVRGEHNKKQKVAVEVAGDFANAAAYAAEISADFDEENVAYAASYAVASACASDHYGAYAHCYEVAVVVLDFANSKDIMQLELGKLIAWQQNNEIDAVPPEMIALSPLWGKEGDYLYEWQEAANQWFKVMSDYGQEDFAKSYMIFLESGEWDIEASLKRFDRWYEENQNKNDTTPDIGEQEQPPLEDALEPGAEENIDPEDSNASVVAAKQAAIHLAGRAAPGIDQPAEEDKLGREALVKALAAILNYENYPGRMTIGLLGHWGAGKSSVLKMLENELKEAQEKGSSAPEYVFATFNAWAYEHTNNIQAGMAQEVVNGLTQGLEPRHRLDLAERFALLTEPYKYLFTLFILAIIWIVVIALVIQGGNSWVAWGAAIITIATFWRKTKTVFSHPLAKSLNTYLRLPAFGKHLGELPIIQGQVKTMCDLVLNPKDKNQNEGINQHGLFERELGKNLSAMQTRWRKLNSGFQERLRKFIWRGAKERRLLFMIDDLDRCGVSGVVNTLEAVRLVMDRPNVTTIIAIDHRMALAALSVHYFDLADKGSDRTSHAIARDYLGKIFNLPIQLDEPGKDGLEAFIKDVLFSGEEDKDKDKEQDEKDGENKDASSELVDSPETTGDGASEEHTDEEFDQNSIDGEQTLEDGQGGFEVVSGGDADQSSDSDEDDLSEEDVSGDDQEVVVERESNSTEDIERDTVNDVIKDTKDEHKQFYELASCLNLSNPRQLKRLHNSYRLLKAIEFHRTDDSTQTYGRNHLQLMTMLFWLEYVSCLDVKQREVEEHALLMRALKNGQKGNLDGDHYKKVREDFGDESQVDQVLYNKTKKYVETFMLPCADVNGDAEKNFLTEIKKLLDKKPNPD